jgi:hypothetical protein
MFIIGIKSFRWISSRRGLCNGLSYLNPIPLQPLELRISRSRQLLPYTRVSSLQAGFAQKVKIESKIV